MKMTDVVVAIEDWDPNVLLVPNQHEYRIYGDDNAQTWAVVDEEDYQFLTQWKWSWNNPSTKKRERRKKYLRRNIQTILDPTLGGGLWTNPITGVTSRNRGHRIQQTLFLHFVVMLRTGKSPPTPKHTIVDHRDGDEFNCRRKNLRWYTPSQNGSNLYGCNAEDLFND